MMLHFTKMHGAGNDFIVLDDWRGTLPWQQEALMTAIAARRTGIGCEGILLLQNPGPESGADFRMRFINPDGGEAGMCGNGARCAALFAYRHGIAGQRQRILTRAGIVQAEILDPHPFEGQVRLTFATPAPMRTVTLDCAGRSWTAHLLDTGVPHAVVFVADAQSLDVRALGRALRHHAAFAPGGANIDFVEVLPDRQLRVRTYERGVEDESGACGTGAVASALAAIAVEDLRPPLTLHVSSGDRLTVDTVPGPDGQPVPTLTGPALEVFQGTLDLSAFEQHRS